MPLGMERVESLGHVGQPLDKPDALGIADNTIVMYSSDNGAEAFSWPDGGTTPFRGEKNENWEGGFRVPLALKWPGVIEPGQVSNEIISQMDWIPTFLAAVGDKTFKVHLDGYSFLPCFSGATESGPRHEFFYFSDTGDRLNLRYDDWKVVFAEQRAEGLDVWQEPFTFLRLPKLFNLRSDPFERADQISMGYPRWRVERAFALIPAQGFVAQFLATFKDYPPRQKPGSSTGRPGQRLSLGARGQRQAGDPGLPFQCT